LPCDSLDAIFTTTGCEFDVPLAEPLEEIPTTTGLLFPCRLLASLDEIPITLGGRFLIGSTVELKTGVDFCVPFRISAVLEGGVAVRCPRRLFTELLCRVLCTPMRV